MRRETLFTIDTIYRQPLPVTGFCYGSDERTACIVGALRGNEIQQMYTASQLVRTLEELEAGGMIAESCGIMVVPCVNQFSMNVGRRFWAMDNTDINRMFPGYKLGETTQRIAANLFERIRDYKFGFHLASFYLPGDFLPHVRMMDTGYQDEEMAMRFNMPYVIVRKPQPYDTTTLNYNWQVFGTDAFSVYTKETDIIDEASARLAVDAIIDFLAQAGVLKCKPVPHGKARILPEEMLHTLHAPAAGIFRCVSNPGDVLHAGDTMAEILNPYTGRIAAEISAPVDGELFFAHRAQLTSEHDVVFRMIRKA